MKRLFSYIILICIFFIVGCSDSNLTDYDDTDVAAIVRGEQITVGYLRFLYPDDRILDYIDGTVKAKLAEQEVKSLNLDVSKKLQEIEVAKSERVSSVYPPEEDDTEVAIEIREFADAQASKLGMAPEEYYEKYFEKTQKMVVYVTAYTKELLGEPKDNGEDYTKKANKLLNKLVEENKDEIQILIK
ncbi:hypothetical protein HNQ94_000951 [Salirhabdus euzebyi]|uniref:Lipoprotein n=1 Tax=Salirhabdus euzebyi TaxID=394506 RepID=A0A841PY44_9BACI|nr:hypothetical protein [Salirhabdus euzebyi]MBB6452506.1 hypothetical protein [Salirhabdus euzebyi]